MRSQPALCSSFSTWSNCLGGASGLGARHKGIVGLTACLEHSPIRVVPARVTAAERPCGLSCCDPVRDSRTVAFKRGGGSRSAREGARLGASKKWLRRGLNCTNIQQSNYHEPMEKRACNPLDCCLRPPVVRRTATREPPDQTTRPRNGWRRSRRLNQEHRVEPPFRSCGLLLYLNAVLRQGEPLDFRLFYLVTLWGRICQSS